MITIIDKKFKNLNLEIKKDESDSRVFEAIITNDSVDSDKECLLPEGMDYKEFLSKRGTIFYNHDYSLPIGKILTLRKSQNSYKARIEIASRPKDYQGEFFPDFVYAMIKQGMIKGISVGYEIKDFRLPTKKDLKDFKDVVRIITSWKLIEVSVAPLQANSDAVITSVKSLLSKELATKLFNIKIEDEKKINITLLPKKESKQEIIDREVNIELLKRKGVLYL